MEIDVNEKNKIVTIWLTNTEKDNMELRAQLTPLYEKYYNANYLVGVFESGSCDLYQSTLDLLKKNRRLTARNAVK